MLLTAAPEVAASQDKTFRNFKSSSEFNVQTVERGDPNNQNHETGTLRRSAFVRQRLFVRHKLHKQALRKGR